MRLNQYEKQVQREIDEWQHGSGSVVTQALNWAMQPMDWVVRQIVSPDIEEQADAVVSQFLSILSDASEWTYDAEDIIADARKADLEAETLDDLRDQPLDKLDELARGRFTQNAVLAAVEGGGAGLGGVALIAADIPLLFTINLRLIQQIGACYGFAVSGEEFQPLVLSIFNVATSGGREAKSKAIREITVAAAAFAGDLEYRGRIRGSFKEQNRHLPREIAKNLVGRKLAQMVPIAGAAVGAGINYWFTTETAQAAFMLFRTLYLERKERA